MVAVGVLNVGEQVEFKGLEQSCASTINEDKRAAIKRKSFEMIDWLMWDWQVK